jgi:pyruvate/2-oxoglutarate dehydrogenase complex dihydrolipoamide dehydrogenase (E3) component
LTTQLGKLSVELKLNEECTVTTIEENRPDAVIVATGAMPIIPDIPGIEGTNVVTAMEVLAGDKGVGPNVVIIGGGSIGCETAEFLYQKGKRVILLEMLDRIGADIGEMNRWVVIDRLNESEIRVETNATVEDITEKGVRVARPNGLKEFFGADSVVIAVGMKSVDKLAGGLKGKVASIYRAGDCVKTHKVKQVIEEGFLAGLKV